MTAVWLYGTLVGELTRGRGGTLRFEYSDEAIGRWGIGSTVLSTSMPASTAVRPPGNVASAFVRNLLPEGSALATFRTTFRALDDFALLEAIGADTAGAVVVGEDPTATATGEPTYLSLNEVGDLLDGLPIRPLGAGPAVRHSLAGAQSKLLLGRTLDGRWYESSPTHPSTHLLKPAPLDHGEVADNEAFCMDVARLAGIDTCGTETMRIGHAHVLVAERYDRLGGLRTHQEDGCQMLGLAPEKKYQHRRAGGKTIGPSLAGIARWLSEADRIHRLEAQVLNVRVGNADGHGKNTSVLHATDGTIRLAPVYDVMSTAVHHRIDTVNGPKPLTDELGMLIGGA
jgi:serine/threonine-protein kinase HipA